MSEASAMAITDDSFVERFTKRISEYCDAPEIFLTASAYHLLSSLLGPFFASKTIAMASEFGMKLNVWILLSSIPGRMRRSTIHNYENYVYKKVLNNWYSNEEDKKKISTSIIDEGTPEGIADHINLNPALSKYVIKTPEFGGVLSKTKEGGYEYGLPTFLSKLYDGAEWTQYLSGRGGKTSVRSIPSGLYVTMFAGMQEPELYLDEKMLRQGLLRRIIICYVTPDMLTMSK